MWAIALFICLSRGLLLATGGGNCAAGEYWCQDRCGSNSYGDTCCETPNGQHNLCGSGTICCMYGCCPSGTVCNAVGGCDSLSSVSTSHPQSTFQGAVENITITETHTDTYWITTTHFLRCTESSTILGSSLNRSSSSTSTSLISSTPSLSQSNLNTSWTTNNLQTMNGSLTTILSAIYSFTSNNPTTITEPDGQIVIASGSLVIIGSSTITLPLVSAVSTLTTDGETFTLSPAASTATIFSSSAASISMGGAATTFTDSNGQTVVSSGDVVVIGSDTVTLPTVSSHSVITTDGDTFSLEPPTTTMSATGSTTGTFSSSSSGVLTLTESNSQTSTPPTLTSTLPYTGTTQNFTVPDGPTITWTVPSGSPPIIGFTTITTDGSTFTIGQPPPTGFSFSPSSTVTSTMTTLPPGVYLQDFTDFPITTNIWLTTTGSDSSTTIVPVILPCPTCEPEIVWNIPEIPWVVFLWPGLPELSGFHFPCIKIFGIHIAGECPSPSGPPPVNDVDPPSPKPSHEPGPPEDDAEDDPCEFDTRTGMCENGNYPVFDPSSGTIKCDASQSQVGQCQKKIDNNLDAIRKYVENEKSCCPASSKAKRTQYGSIFSFLLDRGLASIGLNVDKRADFCPQPGQDPRQPPAGQCYATYTCPHDIFPNVCGNAKSAINVRGATSILTHVAGSALHNNKAWYDGHFISPGTQNPRTGWKLDKCQVEEYPFGSGNPNRNSDGSATLRLIPGGTFRDGFENQNHGIHLRRWLQSVAKRYNEATGQKPSSSPNGIVYCVDFDASFTRFLPEDQVGDNFCASIYGVEFTLVNDFAVAGARTWDPWFDVPNTNRKKPELWSYRDPDGNEVVGSPGPDDFAVYETLPPTYCRSPSPGWHAYDAQANTWSLAAGSQALGRDDSLSTNERCTDPPGTGVSLAKREVQAQAAGSEANSTRTHPRDLARRQGSPGGFLDAKIYKWLGCDATSQDDDDNDGDPCAADDSPCGDAATNVPTTNGANPTQDPAPAPSEGGHSTGLITSLPPGQTPPTFVSCSTRNPDPDLGVPAGYCVCSGSTFPHKTFAAVTPVNVCAYTSPLPSSTTSISTLPVLPTTTTIPNPTPIYVLYIYVRIIARVDATGPRFPLEWDGISFFADRLAEADPCDHQAHPIVFRQSADITFPAAQSYPTSLGTFALTNHPKCSYLGPNTASVGSIACDDGHTAACTAAPTASQTSGVYCKPGTNGLIAAEWWFWDVYCPYR